MISADSHIMEDPQLWKRELPKALQDVAPVFPELQNAGFSDRPGGSDPKLRVSEMEQDGVSGEVLYPSFALDLFGLTDVRLQQACFVVYNDAIAAYCSTAPERLFGVATLSVYDIEWAVAELERSRNLGLRGAMVWQAPPPGLEFFTDHYDPLWSAAEEMGIPISLHILTGHGYPFPTMTQMYEVARTVVNEKLRTAATATSDLITSGVLERFPDLKLVLVENEISWLPFVLSQWDKYASRQKWQTPMERLPSEYFATNFRATFFNDPAAQTLFSVLPAHSLMWSNDYPHPNSTWPDSASVIRRDLDHLDADLRERLLCRNVCELYGLPLAGGNGQPLKLVTSDRT